MIFGKRKIEKKIRKNIKKSSIWQKNFPYLCPAKKVSFLKNMKKKQNPASASDRVTWSHPITQTAATARIRDL